MSPTTHLAVVIPAYNEAGRIVGTLQAICRYLAKQSYTSHIVVVDSASTDGTGDIVRRLSLPNVQVLTLSKKRGKGDTVHHGMLETNAEWVLMCDADGATPIEQLDKFWPYTERNQVVIGSRYGRGGAVYQEQTIPRIVVARLGNLLAQALLLPGISDTQCGFKLFRGDTVHAIFSQQTILGWGFDMEILYIARRLHYRIASVPVEWHNEAGSKVSSRAFFSSLGELLQIRLNAWSGKYPKHLS